MIVFANSVRGITQTVVSPNNKYIVVKTGSIENFTEANNYCMNNFGTNLASIHSADDNTEAYNLCISMIESGDLACRIGLYQSDRSIADTGVTAFSSWSYIDGTSFDYAASNWGNNEPQGGLVENCAALHCPYGTGCVQWIDIPCTSIAEFQIILCNWGTLAPSRAPSIDPTKEPTTDPTKAPTNEPTQDPTNEPSENPTTGPIEDLSCDTTPFECDNGRLLVQYYSIEQGKCVWPESCPSSSPTTAISAADLMYCPVSYYIWLSLTFLQNLL